MLQVEHIGLGPVPLTTDCFRVVISTVIKQPTACAHYETQLRNNVNDVGLSYYRWKSYEMPGYPLCSIQRLMEVLICFRMETPQAGSPC